MKAESQSSPLGSTAGQRLLVLVSAALLTALVFGALFEATAHLTNWVLTSGFERLHPVLRTVLTVMLPLVWTFAGTAIGVNRYHRTRRHRALRRQTSLGL